MHYGRLLRRDSIAPAARPPPIETRGSSTRPGASLRRAAKMVTASEAREVEGCRDCSNRLLGGGTGRQQYSLGSLPERPLAS